MMFKTTSICLNNTETTKHLANYFVGRTIVCDMSLSRNHFSLAFRLQIYDKFCQSFVLILEFPRKNTVLLMVSRRFHRDAAQKSCAW